MDSQTEEIKRRIDIVEYIGQYLQLKKAGQNWKGLCPFHNEKTPSFMVNQDRQIYKCFGCGESGDVFDFVQKIESLDFYESLKYLADRAGVELISKQGIVRSNNTPKNRIYELNSCLADLYNQLLTHHNSGERARSYVKSRKLATSTIEAYKVGFAPRNTEQVNRYLVQKGFSGIEMAQAGDPQKFYNRLMFPIFDTVGNAVGFSGRALEDGQEPKYLNTRETDVFHKARILYGFNIAKHEIRNSDKAVVVEGQMDVVLSCQAGVKNVVASSGTALTLDHLLLIRRQTYNVVFMFDSDDAGVKATLNAIELAWQLELQVRVVQIPEGYKDAGEIVEKNPELLKSIIANAMPAIDWIVDYVGKSADVLSQEGKRFAVRTTAPLIESVVNTVEKESYIKKISILIGTSENNLKTDIAKYIANRNTSRRDSVDKDNEKQIPKHESWVELLALLYLSRKKIKDAIKVLSGTMRVGQVARVYESVFEWYNKSQPPYEGDFLVSLPEDVSKKVKVAISDIEISGVDIDQIDLDIDQRLLKIQGHLRDRLKNDFAQRIALAERKKDLDSVRALMEELQDKIK